MKKLYLSIDVEEWFRAENIREYVADVQHKHTSAKAFDAVLDILEEANARATLFIVADDIPRYQQQLLRAKKLDFEFASHTVNHKLMSQLDYAETYEQVTISKQVIEQKFSKKVTGFRSPCFSTNKHLGEALSYAGYSYSSNGIQATIHDRYRNNIVERQRIHDFGLPVSRIAGLKLPSTGGGWFRLFPLGFQIKELEKTTQENIFYCHPWDFDTNQPMMEKVPPIARFRHKVGAQGALNKLRKLVRRFDCRGTLEELYNEKYC